jgi:peptidoglycan-associated lipoprotein
MIAHWMSYREFWFENDLVDIHKADAKKVTEIAAYLKANPSLQVGLDSSPDPDGSAPRNADLDKRRNDAVRNALIKAGVPASQIKSGTFGDPDLRRDRRVEVLLITTPKA